MANFDHERLDVYQVGIDFVGLADDVVEKLFRIVSMLARLTQDSSGTGTGTGTG